MRQVKLYFNNDATTTVAQTQVENYLRRGWTTTPPSNQVEEKIEKPKQSKKKVKTEVIETSED